MSEVSAGDDFDKESIDAEAMDIRLNTDEWIKGKFDQPISPEPHIQIELHLLFGVRMDLWVSKSDMEKLRGEGIFPIWMEPE